MMTLQDLYAEVAEYGTHSAEYVDKMLHKVPPAPVFDRAEYLIKATRGKVIMDIGATGPMAEVLQQEAAEYYGLDIVDGPCVDHILNLDHADSLPQIDGLQIIVAGEVIEHLSNAGHFLDLLHAAGVQVILTTPNAFGAAGAAYIKRGIESVNKEHVSWYSYHTLLTLVRRHRFQVLIWGWYNGQPLTAEGLIFHMEPDYGDD
jgi:hypothetical protein